MTLAIDQNRDERLALVLDALAKQHAAGQIIDWDAIGREHPDLVDEIRQLLAVGQMIDFVKATPTVAQPVPTAPANLGHPPSAFGDFELLAEIGRGGMGVVYKAFDKKLNRHVALKMIQRGGNLGAEAKRFQSEIKSAGALTHPNIVPVYQEGEHDGLAYYCMRYIEGKTLAALMADKPLPPRDAARYMIAIARGVQHAHEMGILHRH